LVAPKVSIAARRHFQKISKEGVNEERKLFMAYILPLKEQISQQMSIKGIPGGRGRVGALALDIFRDSFLPCTGILFLVFHLCGYCVNKFFCTYTNAR
tara:strand:+ start:223 stop:516 length:294 start_codon:yes stop_codon:yes gene_type:complete